MTSHIVMGQGKLFEFELSFGHFASRNCLLLPHFVFSIFSLLIINLLWFGCEMLLFSHRLMSVKTVHSWWYHLERLCNLEKMKLSGRNRVTGEQGLSLSWFWPELTAS